ncbi:MAG: sigma-70 family RNA polymerase sigma factor [Pseudomonadota bacterium]
MTHTPTNGAEEIFVRDRDKLIATACAIVANRAVAEELVQDSWLRWGTRGYPPQSAGPIFQRIVRNLALDWTRRSRTERLALTAQLHLEETAPDSERVVAARDELRRVVAALEALPERTLLAFRMHRIDGKPYAGIARTLGISPSTAFKLVEDAMVDVVLSLRL